MFGLQSLNVDCSTFLCLLRHERYEENVSFTRLNNFANGSKKNPETYKVPVWLFIFLHILSVSSGWLLFKGRKLHQHANVRGFVKIVTIAELTSQVAGPCEGRARNGNESTLVSWHFSWVTPSINTDQTWNLSEMCVLHVKVVKRDTQWTEVKALSCWSDENETKTRLQLCLPFSIVFDFVPKTHCSSGDCSAS